MAGKKKPRKISRLRSVEGMNNGNTGIGLLCKGVFGFLAGDSVELKIGAQP